MSAARKRRAKPPPRPNRIRSLPWPELTGLFLAAAAAAVWQWSGLKVVFSPWSQAAGGFLALAVPAVLIGWHAAGKDRWLGLSLLGLGALFTRLSSVGSTYLSLVGVAAGVAALFWRETTSFLLLLPLVSWTGVAFGGGPAVVALLSGVTMVVLAHRARRGRDLLLAGLGSGLAGGLAAAIFALQAGPFGVGLAFLAGLAASFFVWTSIPVVERAVDRTSPLSLVELLNPSHPLLERLRNEAPGTYYHSRDVAALAEAAARAIGADPLLAAVGGLYHDIGKLLRPQFFAENQSQDNPHDQLPPSMSKVVIASHVKDGIELGRQYGLRGDIIKFIATHHGTSVMRYFSQQGAEQGLSEDDFRYNAPLPDTKETAIVMLADAVEAYARGADRNDLGELIDRVIEERRRDGQLNASPLTLADLAKIRRAFMEVLQGMAHRRAKDYPLPEG